MMMMSRRRTGLATRMLKSRRTALATTTFLTMTRLTVSKVCIFATFCCFRANYYDLLVSRVQFVKIEHRSVIRILGFKLIYSIHLSNVLLDMRSSSVMQSMLISYSTSILVKTATGKTISLEVKGSDTIGNMKVRIQSLEGVPFDQQELIFNEMVLENMNTLANLPIKKDSTLKLMLKSRGFINITIKTPEGILINSLEVKPSDTIGDVKAKMHGTGHVLIFNENVLEDSGTLADLHIVNGSTLTHTLKSVELMKIYVNTFTGKTISLLVSPEYTVAKLKWKI
ncbi:putative Ubiquitin domain-containing protein [Helianthus annuus]|nr:putative Ubiquitin-like domain-containing protein [Helianthus annuus]KAJ0958294.1 putative Ubiquitin domain-containing protein [Helianthus annuus]